jgi:pimeloyl-ACP methyl ester carboxylesterase
MTSDLYEPGRRGNERDLCSAERRTVVKGMISLGAGLAASSFSSEMAQAQSPPASKPAQSVVGTSPGDEVAPIVPSSGIGRYFQVFYPPSQTPGELRIGVNYTLWIPEGIETLRGIIVHQHGAGMIASQFGAFSAYDLHWQALAKKWDCALLGPSYHVLNDGDLGAAGSDYWFDPRLGSDKTFVKALGEFATKTGHAELAVVPWALWGHSAGAGWTDVIATLHPERVVAIYYRSGSPLTWSDRPAMYPPVAIPAAAYAIPRMCSIGVKEKGLMHVLRATYDLYRSNGAPTGFALDPRTGHECGDSRYFAIPFLDACLAMRLPEKGAKEQTLRPVDHRNAWLAAYPGETAVPASEFNGDPKQAAWLPNAAVAKIWMDYVKTGTVADSSVPPAPFGVRVNDKGDQGMEVTWDAEAGLTSGLGGFIVLRDGQGVVRLPAPAPEAIYGRPLFQGLSFHDTPTGPLPRMVYLDSSAKPGVDHIYTVTALSSAGVPSIPAASSAEMRSLTGRFTRPKPGAYDFLNHESG